MGKKNAKHPPASSAKAPSRFNPVIIGVILVAVVGVGALMLGRGGDETASPAAQAGESTQPDARAAAKAEAAAKLGPRRHTTLPPIPFQGYAPPRSQEVITAAYRFAADHPEILSYVPCFCGCEHSGHSGNADCFVKQRDTNGDVLAWDENGANLDCVREARHELKDPLLASCSDAALERWSFDENRFCVGCTYTFYALVECGTEMHLPLADMEGADIAITEVLGGSTPSLAQLQQYQAVLTWSNYQYSNRTTMGDNLADYGFFTHLRIEGERQPRLGRNLDPLSFGENLDRGTGAGPSGSPDRCPLAAPGDRSNDGAQGRRSANHFGRALAAPLAGLGDVRGEQIDGLAVDAENLNEDFHATREYRANLVAVMTRRAVAKIEGK